MFRNLLGVLTLMLLIGGALQAQNFGTLQGKITDADTGEPILFCAVVLTKGGIQAGVVETDFDGNYSIGNLDPGEYDVEVSYIGYQEQLIKGVRVVAGRVVPLNVSLSPGVLLGEVEIVEYVVPLVEQDNTTQGRTITSNEIRALPLKNINAIAASTAGLSTIDGESIAMRGSRPDATDYYIDGIRVRGALVPQFEIEQMQVITGGIEAMYGDVSGGVISITTKGPAQRFGGGAEVETSKFLDAYGYNELNLNLSGPLVKRNNQSILGFRVSGRYIYHEEPNAPATGVYRASEDLIRDLEANPVRLAAGTPYSSAEAVRTTDDVNLLKARPNNGLSQLDLTGRIDARISRAIDLSFSGSYRTSRNQFTPGGWGVFNWTRNPFQDFESYRTNVRFRHRLGFGGGTTVEGQRKVSVIQNAVYTLQVGYEQRFISQEDRFHGDNLFRYGHIGNFDFFWEPIAGDVGGMLQHAGWLRQLEGAYSPSVHNPVLANFNNILSPAQLSRFDEYINVNGLQNPNFTGIYGFHSNVGRVHNTFSQSEISLFTFNANASFDFLPGGSERGRHSIQFGVLYEQRVDRAYNLAPFGLYNLARLRANSHFNGVDYTRPTDEVIVLPNGQELTVYEPLIVEPTGSTFYRKVREAFGHPLNQYFNVDGVDPDLLTLDMFSSLELTDQGIVGFNGYDYLGNKVGRDTRFNDFFRVEDDGSRRFLVAPQQPIYSAFFIQDKFTYKDIIFRLGLRVDRFDNNTKVLRDPLALYPIMSAEDFHSEFGGERPSTIGSDFKVYTTADDGTIIKAYRDGERWFDASGNAVSDGNVIWGGELVTRRYYGSVNDPENNIKDDRFDPDRSFVDYTPQVNWMPRIAVSFPISDEANFFAHYDILVQRPPTNSFESPLNYYYFEDRQGTRNNPALRPERTIDYEVGFQQRLTTASAVKISAFYKEMRDMIQFREILYVPPPINRYSSYDNIDFGTVKGFYFQYELRRTRNISLVANYTLQFADGTGSDANSQRGIALRGNLRTLFPLARDERHAVKGVFDFRYDSGKRYNGPRLFGKDILANSGFNFQMNALSGRPYTRNQRALPFGGEGFAGSINGARLPWNFTIDLRIEKTVRINSVQAAKPANVTFSLRVLNLFDTRNIRGVFPVTGSPFDSGFLASSDGQASISTIATAGQGLINAGRDVEAYLSSYQWANLFPGFFTLPRRVFLAAIFDF
jgi:hypothetical protein